MYIGWQSVKEETENIAKRHSELAEQLIIQVEEPIQNFLKDTRKPRTQIRDAGRKSIKDLQAAEARRDACKKEYEQARLKQDQTKYEYDQATMNNQQSPHLEKISKRMKVESKKATQADKKYNEAVDSFRHLQDKFYDEEMPKYLDEFYGMEETRIERLRQALLAYVEYQRGVSPEILSSCERMQERVFAINKTNDLQSFINEKRTGAQKPDRCVYEPYNPDLQRCVRTSEPSSSSMVSAAPRASAAPSRSAPAVSRAPAAAPPQNIPRGMGQCRGLFDYQATDPGELSFRAGDIITILQKDPSGWWQGELNNVIGVFPSVGWVEEVGAGGGSVPQARPAVAQSRALYEYQAENDAELTIYPGDIITVEGDEDGWFLGHNQRGEFGRYPSNYVEMI